MAVLPGPAATGAAVTTVAPASAAATTAAPAALPPLPWAAARMAEESVTPCTALSASNSTSSAAACSCSNFLRQQVSLFEFKSHHLCSEERAARSKMPSRMPASTSHRLSTRGQSLVLPHKRQSATLTLLGFCSPAAALCSTSASINQRKVLKDARTTTRGVRRRYYRASVRTY